jgi:phage/plasmid-associated DNA primase
MKVEPRFLAMITTNHIPIFGPVFSANTRRFMCVDFPVSFVDLKPGEANSRTRKQKDNTLAGRLASDLPGVLRWLVMGAVDWYTHGNLMKDSPEKVKVATKGYMSDQDHLGQFIEEKCGANEEFSVPTTVFVSAFKHAHITLEEAPKFSYDVMRLKGYPQKKISIDGQRNSRFMGLRVKDEWLAPNPYGFD